VRSWSFRRYVVTICTAALLAGCGGPQPLVGAPGALPQNRAPAARAANTNYKVVYNFGTNPADGEGPKASLIDVGGTLYGTTWGGGGNLCYSSYYINTCGTVFSVTPGGSEKVLHRFSGTAYDANLPIAGLIDVGGTLYGTTYGGGRYDWGAVYTITTGGTENVLYSFGAGSDGRNPYAGLIDIGSTLYGTTDAGGAYNAGTVFSITLSGTENVLHSFGRRRRPRFPTGALIDAGGALYGTTYSGGAHKKGTVFRITPSGRMKVLHNFGNGTDGENPYAGLIEVKGTFYGTTAHGGVYSCGAYGGCGTVFSITGSGTEKVVHSFGAAGDGSAPKASLIDVKGTFYGTSHSGGAGTGCYLGCGTVFSITASGTENVLHSFGSSTSDGALPNAALIYVNGTLYGTTEGGGTNGHGTVFALTP
jgi:uncharacterized repeat protein (TIGR03803 family)